MVRDDGGREAYTAKYSRIGDESLAHVRQSRSISAVNRAVDLLTRSKNRLLNFFGLGSSAAAGARRHEQIFRFNVPVIYSFATNDIVLLICWATVDRCNSDEENDDGLISRHVATGRRASWRTSRRSDGKHGLLYVESTVILVRQSVPWFGGAAGRN